MSDLPPSDQQQAPAVTDVLTVKVKNADGHEVSFKLRPNTPLRKLMESYCTKTNKPLESVRFLYDGERIARDQTPGELQMEDGDEIDALIEQTGGC